MSWRAERKVITFPGAGSETPENILARTLEKARAGHIKSVVIGIEFDDSSAACDWSNMKQRDFAWLVTNLEYELHEMMSEAERGTDWAEPGPTG